MSPRARHLAALLVALLAAARALAGPPASADADVLDGAKPQLRTCYLGNVKSAMGLRGSLTLAVRIEASGAVSSARVVKSGMGMPPYRDQCAARAVEKIRFAAGSARKLVRTLVWSDPGPNQIEPGFDVDEAPADGGTHD